MRHPDMPREALADMWDTLHQERAWLALVKNRRKNVDHCWVRASARPVHRSGQLVVYISVRTTPLRAEVSAADTLYRRSREGRARDLRFCQGLVMRRAGPAWMPCGRRMAQPQGVAGRRAGARDPGG
ncbi:PAS domain-containing protein [Hydrogenophaga sp.]|uniref:PAS domain-containing protein n=1 Tax=Hydrogenophaga sp. TaxID=1904254 RepID=UPI0035213E69